ncbi:MAG: 4Fe-4S binding protein [Chloroflexi bacterium]|nr:4Fe-4S binding protein [Chloroflexota bacterium]
MKVMTMWRDALQGLIKRPATQRYPFVRQEAPERLRGHLVWDPDSCTGCGLCAKDCPADAIEVIVLDKKAKRFVFRYHVDRCTFCAQCVASCRQGCLSMLSDRWELAAFDKDSFLVQYGDEADVEAALAGEPEPDATPAE